MFLLLLGNQIGAHRVAAMGFLVSWVFTFIALNRRFSFLPLDQGKAFVEGGDQSKGKLRGVGLVIIIAFIVTGLLFAEVSPEYVIFLILIFAVMMSGYLDDASDTPWSDYKKGAIDLGISIIYVVSFIHWNGTEIQFFHWTLTLHPLLYAILGIILIWVSINVTNCADGIDGLCTTLVIITIGSFLLIFGKNLGNYVGYSVILIGAMLAYLCFNTLPSTMLMGDAGSRAFGFFIAVLAMKSRHPFSFLLLAIVLILDGGLGLAKIFLLRFLKIRILANTRTPLHDEVRKNQANRNWSKTQIVFRFAIVQVMFSMLAYILLA